MCRKVRDEIKNKHRFHFFQRRPQTNKYIHKGNNAKQKPHVTLVTDSDESWRNSPMPYTITPDYKATNRYPSSLAVPPVTTSQHYSTNTTQTVPIKPNDRRNHTISHEIDRKNHTNAQEVYHPPPGFSPKSFRSRPNQSVRKHSDLEVKHITRQNDPISTRAIPPRSLQFAGE